MAILKGLGCVAGFLVSIYVEGAVFFSREFRSESDLAAVLVAAVFVGTGWFWYRVWKEWARHYK